MPPGISDCMKNMMLSHAEKVTPSPPTAALYFDRWYKLSGKVILVAELGIIFGLILSDFSLLFRSFFILSERKVQKNVRGLPEA